MMVDGDYMMMMLSNQQYYLDYVTGRIEYRTMVGLLWKFTVVDVG